MKTNQLLTTVTHQLGEHRQLLIAFSGGLDSTVLLHLLVQLRQVHPDFLVRAVHVNHGLSALADDWADHCRRQCDTWQVPLRVQRVHVNTRTGGIEAAARSARYITLNASLKADEILLTAHHLDDQSETFLLALKRGSGPAGLSAMAACGSIANHVLLRPLIGCSRLQIKMYAQQHQLSWIDDESNNDTYFDRNFLRLQVLQLLKLRWPHFTSAVARSASLCAEQEKLLDELLTEQLQALLGKDGSLLIKGLLGYSAVCRFALLRRWITRHNVTMPSRKQLQHLWDEVALSRVDATPRLQLATYQIRRFQGRLYLLPLMVSLRNICLNWSRTTPLILPDRLGKLINSKGNIYLRPPQPTQQVTVRFSAKGSIRIIGRTHSRPIKKLWQELNVPPWLRERTPLIYYNEKLIAALGTFISEEGRVQENEKPWQLHWEKIYNDKT